MYKVISIEVNLIAYQIGMASPNSSQFHQLTTITQCIGNFEITV
jgi:hypothetical protein